MSAANNFPVRPAGPQGAGPHVSPPAAGLPGADATGPKAAAGTDSEAAGGRGSTADSEAGPRPRCHLGAVLFMPSVRAGPPRASGTSEPTLGQGHYGARGSGPWPGPNLPVNTNLNPVEDFGLSPNSESREGPSHSDSI